MNVDNAKSQMRKGMLEYCIMLLLREKPYYTSDIIKRLKEANLLEWKAHSIRSLPGLRIRGFYVMSGRRARNDLQENIIR